MAKTLISSTSTWLPALEFLKRADPRTIADVVGDEGVRPYKDDEGNVNKTLLAADENLIAALRSASGQFEGAVFAGARYSKEDLDTIAASDCNARAYMYDIISRICRFKAVERRLEMDPNAQVPAWYKEAKDALEDLRNGKNIFGFAEQADAGLPTTEFMTPDEFAELNLTTSVAKRWFGTRGRDIQRP